MEATAKADFAGWATVANVKCSDGRTIQPDAFKHQHGERVPLVWQHGHGDIEHVLGHAILEARPEGMYAYGFFNETAKAQHAALSLKNRDIRRLSIWANKLAERAGQVMHGIIQEVSLVLAGANPGAIIESINIRHADGTMTTFDDEAIIHTGLDIEHGLFEEEEEDPNDPDNKDPEDPNDPEDPDNKDPEDPDDKTVSHADGEDETVEDVYNSMTDKQKQVLHFMIGEALESAAVEHSNLNPEGNTGMNVFEQNGRKGPEHVISHDDMQKITASASKSGSLKEAVIEYALSHGITTEDELKHGIDNLDVLFPDARSIQDTPEWNKRRTEWVTGLMASVRKSPFSRIKTFSADITHDEARAKGYVKGNLKKEEFFGILKRVTTPTTVYKKQKLDRDDIIDITDFDVVAWMKGEMRIMLDEEIARAILIGDGRDVSHEDKINEGNIRPVATDNELYVTTLNVNLDDASSSTQEFIDAIVGNRYKFRGTGTPNFYTTERYISKLMLLKDGMGRRMYRSLAEVADELRVAEIIPVEVMEDVSDLVGIIFNPIDYVVGADKGGNVAMFDDFDIDYNQYKYLIETRLSGALTKIKCAIVIRKVAGSALIAIPDFNNIAFNESTGALTITNQTGVVFKNEAGTVINAAGSPYTVPAGTTYKVYASPAAGYYFPTSDDDVAEYVRPA